MKSIWLVILTAATAVGQQPAWSGGFTSQGSMVSPAVAGFRNAALPDPALMSWDTSMAATPASGPNVCVEKSRFVNPGGITCGTTFDTGAPATDLGNALASAVCGDVLVLANIPYLGNFTLPNGLVCPNSNWVIIEHDITDTTFPAEGHRIDPCYFGIAQTTMPYYPYPGWDLTPSTCARHMPQLIAVTWRGTPALSLKVPTGIASPTLSVSHIRIVGIEFTRDQSFDIAFSIVDMSYQPSLTGQDCATTGSGASALPVNALACMNDQPDHIIFDRDAFHGDAQRQTQAGITMAGTRWIAIIDSYGYDIGSTVAGGDSDAKFYAWGTGHGYTGVGWGKFANNFTSASTMGSLFCGAFTEPLSPATGFDGVPQNVWWNQDHLYKNILWDTQIGQTFNESLTIEGQSYPPANDQEMIITPSAIQLAEGQTYQLQLYWGNDSFGGLNRMGAGTGTGGGTVTVDGITNGNSSVGIITRNPEHNVGTAPWQSANQITYTYTAPATTGTHTITFNALGFDSRLATLGNSRTITGSATITVVSANPAQLIAVSPAASDLQIQPSYSDANGNTRQFCGTFFEFPNYSPGAVTWSVDGIAGGNSSVGTVTTPTGVVPGEAVYCSGTSLGSHTIRAADGTTTGSSTLTVSTTAPIVDYDWRPFTSKNGWEAKCLARGLLQNSLVENGWGSQGNGGGQQGTPMLIQAINQSSQTNDGNGVNVGYGPEYISDVTLDHVMFAHFGGGFVVVPLDAALGIHRISFSNLLCDDCNVQRWGHGFLKIIAGLQTGGTAGTKVLGWTSAATPLADNVSFNHVTEVGNFTNPFAINNNNAQFKLINFTFQNSFFAAAGSSTFVNANGEANDCDTAAGIGSTNTELKALVPCFAPYTFDHLNLTDSSACPNNVGCSGSVFISSPIWQSTHSAVGFVNYNSGNGGDYRLCTGVNLPAAPCAGVSSFAAGQAYQASDGRDLGADIAGINAVQGTVRGGVRTP